MYLREERVQDLFVWFTKASTIYTTSVAVCQNLWSKIYHKIRDFIASIAKDRSLSVNSLSVGFTQWSEIVKPICDGFTPQKQCCR